MAPEQFIHLSMARSAHYFDVLRTTFFTFTGLAAIIQLGPNGYSAPLMMLVIATTAYGVLAGGTALDDIINLRADMDPAIAGSTFGRGLAARNLPALKMVSAVLLGLVGLAEVYAIVT